MRKLIEEQDRKTELLDGIKVFHEKGWTLILPTLTNRFAVFSVREQVWRRQRN
jgi:hypothetical protein